MSRYLPLYAPMKIGQIAGLLEEHIDLIYSDCSLRDVYYRLVDKAVKFQAGFETETQGANLGFQTADLPDSVLDAFKELKAELNRHGITLSAAQCRR